MITTEERSPEVLDTWDVTVPLPERPSFGPNRFRPTEEARLSAARRRLRAAGHAKDAVDGQPSDCHPTLASIARAEGISATRVGQLLALLHLDLEIIEVLDRPRGELPEGLTRRAVREIARLRGHEAQRAAFEARWPGVLGRRAGQQPRVLRPSPG